MSTLSIFGIRHHGPGSARSLRQALIDLAPDCILVEGPPEADAILHHIQSTEMQPPLALLLYAKDMPKHAAFYPFAAYSPEWQALQYGLREQIPTRFMDLPSAFRFAHDLAQAADADQLPSAPDPQPTQPQDPLAQVANKRPSVRQDPLGWVAEAAGYSDGERWWEQLVEERTASEGVFAAILDLMTALREEADKEDAPDIWEQRREAYMRKCIRDAQKAGHQNIAVVCGAWHAPVLQVNQRHTPTRKHDTALLKGLPKAKVAATWIPWTSARLARNSGYGAGVDAPGWYAHMWRYSAAGTRELSTQWLTRTARLLRTEGIAASSAQVIDGVRLAETLAAMRGRTAIGLAELSEASYAVFANGNAAVLDLIKQKLIVGDVLGAVSAAVPTTPLQLDLHKSQKRLRLAANAVEKQLVLDLRKPNDLARSQLLHRLRLLGVPWGVPLRTSGKGTFKEGWQLQWQPEFEVRVIEAGRYGQSLAQASSHYVTEMSATAQNLAELTALLDDTLLADLPDATTQLVQRIHISAAEANDMQHLMQALPQLTHVLRYGNVRTQHQQDVTGLESVVQGIFTRICVGLPMACRSLAAEAAETMFTHLLQVHAAVKLLQNQAQISQWLDTLAQMRTLESVHALIKGRVNKILFEEERLDSYAVAQALGLALSDPDLEQAGAWLEGLLQDGGLLLMHDDALFDVIDSWFETLSSDSFRQVLPLVRRTFASFEVGERHNIGRKAKGDRQRQVMPTFTLNPQRGQGVLEHIQALIGTAQLS